MIIKDKMIAKKEVAYPENNLGFRYKSLSSFLANKNRINVQIITILTKASLS
tara:strand:- start:333 stop:488 length:156 start_codon:yes stop_codon:yes gene_type:complete